MEEDYEKCTCEEGGGEFDTCPYNLEINDDEESYCNCCPHCRYECSMSI